MSEPPGPDPAMVKAARAYLTSRYAQGVEQVLWEDDAYPMSDLDAINAVRAPPKPRPWKGRIWRRRWCWSKQPG